MIIIIIIFICIIILQVSPICQLSLSDFLASSFLLVGAALYTQQDRLTNLGVACSFITSLAAVRINFI